MIILIHMKNSIKNKKSIYVGRQGGFLQIIILILIALFVMKYSGITISDVINWFKATFNNVLR